MNQALVRYRRTLIVLLHLVLVPAGFALAFVLRFDGRIPEQYIALMLATIPAVVVLRLGAFALFGLFTGWWRHVSMFDLKALVKAVTASTVALAIYLIAVGDLPGFPRAILLLDWGVAIGLFGGSRFAVRWLRERGMGRGWELGGKRALIVGAGDAAASLLRQIRDDPDGGITPVGLVDDDPGKRDVQLHGIPVLGDTEDIPRLVREHGIAMVVLAIASASREEMRQIAERCTGLGVELKIVPSFRELLDGRARLDQLRSVEPEELLGRAPVQLDLARVRDDIEGAVVLVTGGAGSIGAELARQVSDFGPARLILFEQAESPLYFTELELRQRHPDVSLVAIVGDVTDEKRMETVFARHRPDFVFHAAAYKHVPMMEENVTEAVRNNVLGTWTVAELAARYGVRRFVFISTDKAVRPSSVMGATKRTAERLILGLPELRNSQTDFRAVRFGNVLGSSGSVIPLFRQQIQRGGPVTVTDPDVTRYFMTIPEAVQLVLQAATVPVAAGRISMLEMGEPVRIVDMAENLIRLSGLEPYEDIPIVFTGIRAGEKLHEELTLDVEATIPTPIEKVRVVERRESDGASVAAGLKQLRESVDEGNLDQVLRDLCALVPEAVPPLAQRAQRAQARRAIRPSRLFAGPRGAGERPGQTEPSGARDLRPDPKPDIEPGVGWA